jgi:uncharacterized protein (TIGR03435 family)
MLVRGTLLLLAVALAAPVAQAQAPPPADETASVTLPLFEVISVKQNKTARGWGYSRLPDGYAAHGITLKQLIFDAYEMRAIGGPGWWEDTRFDIQAKVADSDIAALQTLSYHQRAAMVQQILTDRFKLKAHREVIIKPIYSLVVSKQGLLIESPGPAGLGWRPGKPGTSREGQLSSPRTITMADLAGSLEGITGRKVIDNTGMTGTYRGDLHFSADNVPGFISDAAPATPTLSIFTALQEQLGLKLVPTTGPVDYLVVDHVEMPSEN